MIDAQKEATEAIRALAEALKNMPPTVVENGREYTPDAPKSLSTEANGQNSEVSSGQIEPVIETKIVTIYTRERIVENGREYTPETHPLLFAVVDWLEQNPTQKKLSVRKLADAFTSVTGQSVGKSWAAVAKNYWLSNES